LLDRFALRRTAARRPAVRLVRVARRVSAIVLLAIRNFSSTAPPRM